MTISLEQIPTCGYFSDGEPKPVNYCGLVGYKVELRVCKFCSKNGNGDAILSPPLDPAVLAAVRQQQAGCKGCGDSPMEGV